VPRKFDPDRHCGAPKKNGQPCTQPKGFATSHAGQGFCHLHEDPASLSDPLPTPNGNGKEHKNGNGNGTIAPIPPPPLPKHTTRPHLIGNQNARRHGLYAKVLTGADKVRYEAVQEHHPAEILKDSFYLVHSRLLAFLENDIKFGKQDQLILDAAMVLAESGELDEDYIKARLIPALSDMPLEKLAGIANSTISMANAAVFLDRMGSLQAQNGLLMTFLRDVLRGGDRHLRELAIMTLEQLKLETGLPTEEILEALQVVHAKPTEDEDVIEADAVEEEDQNAQNE
jgi:hypothetical protein